MQVMTLLCLNYRSGSFSFPHICLCNTKAWALYTALVVVILQDFICQVKILIHIYTHNPNRPLRTLSIIDNHQTSIQRFDISYAHYLRFHSSHTLLSSPSLKHLTQLMQLTSSSQSKSPAYHHLSMPSLSLEFLSTFFSLLISSHRNVHRFYPHILASSSFLSPPPNTHTNLSQPQPLRNPTLNFFTHPQNSFLSNLINASILLLPIILLFRLYKRGFHEKLHDFIIPFAFCLVWGMFIFEDKEELIKTDVVVFTILPWLVFLGLLLSWVCG